MQHILVCDDEKDIVAALKIYLESDGYCVHTAYSGEEALRVAKTEPVQLALMDIMMPGMDGITAMAKLREFSNIPVILLTAKSEDSDKILGLSVGADDYITKPFNPVEVLARVKSQLRRFLQLGAAVKAPSELTVGGICLDHDAKRVTLDGEPIAPARVRLLRKGKETAELSVTIHEGKNRQIRRMCAAVGLHVKRLRRVREHTLSLGALPEGSWRELTADEVRAFEQEK